MSLPTGSRKSLCNWVIPGAFNLLRKTDSSIVLVVSPLIALMKDRVEHSKVRDEGCLWRRSRIRSILKFRARMQLVDHVTA